MFAAPLYGNEGELSGVLIGYVEMRKYAIPNRYLLKERDLVILKFASEQLHSALDRLNYMELIQRMNGQLSDMAVTDQLTGLYNRQGFGKMVRQRDCQEEIKKRLFILIWITLNTIMTILDMNWEIMYWFGLRRY